MDLQVLTSPQVRPRRELPSRCVTLRANCSASLWHGQCLLHSENPNKYSGKQHKTSFLSVSQEFSNQPFCTIPVGCTDWKGTFLKVSVQSSQAVKVLLTALSLAGWHFILPQRCKAALPGPKACPFKPPEIKGQSSKPLCLASHYKESFNLTKLT